MSCFISVTVFCLGARNLGLHVWGMSGVTSTTSFGTAGNGCTTIEGKEVAPEEAFERVDTLERDIAGRKIASSKQYVICLD